MKRINRFNPLILFLLLASSSVFAQQNIVAPPEAITQSTTTMTPVTTVTPVTTTVAPATNSTATGTATATVPATTTTQSTTTTTTSIPTVIVVSDAEIMANVQSKLAQNMTLSGVNINVAANNGIVTLSGTTLTQAQIDEAVRMTKTIGGVKEVISKLIITPSSTVTAPTTETTPSY